jgi:hypothetical protein
MPKPLHAYPDPADPTGAPNLADELWTNAHLCRYFACGISKAIQIKRDPAFPAPARISGLLRYPADQVRAYALSQQARQQTTTPTTTTTEGTAL